MTRRVFNQSSIFSTPFILMDSIDDLSLPRSRFLNEAKKLLADSLRYFVKPFDVV